MEDTGCCGDSRLCCVDCQQKVCPKCMIVCPVGNRCRFCVGDESAARCESQSAAVEPSTSQTSSPDSKSSQKGLSAGAIGIGAGAVGLAALKSKGGLVGLLAVVKLAKFGWILKSFGSMFIYFAIYAARFGWPFAMGMVFLIYVHEMGHFMAMKMKGLEPQAPIFIPFVGAYVSMTKMPPNQAVSAWTAFAGPFVGGLCAGLLFGVGQVYDIRLLSVLGNFGFILNLIQLVPAKPLDGGFLAECISRKLLLPGAVGLLLLAFVLQSPLFIILGFFSIITWFHSGNVSAVPECTAEERVQITVSYLALVVALGLCYWLSSNAIYD